MRARVTWWLLCVLVMSGFASAQSLGAAAREERQRREKNKEQGVVAREYSETQIFGDDGDENEDEVVASDESEDSAPDDTSPSTSPLGHRIDVDIAPEESEAIDEENRDRQLQETEWRTRFREARERVALAREQKAILDGVHHVEGMKLVDDNGNVIVETLDDLRRLVAQASQELIDAENAVKALEEQARREGVPPGWRR